MKNKDEENRRPRCLPFIKLLLNAAFLRTHNWIGKTAKIMLRPSCTRPRARLFYVEDLPQTPASCTPWNGHRVIRLFIRQCRIDRLLQGMHIGYYWLINTVIISLSLSLSPSIRFRLFVKKNPENDSSTTVKIARPTLFLPASFTSNENIWIFRARLAWPTFQSVPLYAVASRSL